ncbi:O-antigen ligase family protein [Lysinibacillus xylanilyticus]|uniref:O-antigen ligase family protein n=1 Tax=Lysinibacillus xylanilyticus TaxID=582475 RepID=UPI002B255687|nr:O-antigen ligase family protein [Lysinibacillus xylanilyticus]MEB2298017.1 O-antigen ligase family protein [Lysinibacillus xylanilyticus]
MGKIIYEKKGISNNYFLIFILVLSVFLGNLNINIGFALKPHMVLMVVIFMLSLSKFVFHKPQIHETFMIFFYVFYCLTGVFSTYPMASLRLTIAIFIGLFSYFIFKFLFSTITVKEFERIIGTVGIVYNVISLLFYLFGLISTNFNFYGNGIRVYGLMLDRSMPRLIGILSDPNIFVVSNSFFLFFFLANMKGKKGKIGFALALITTILTFSRGGLLATLVGIVITIAFLNVKTKIKIFFVIPIMTWISYFIVLKVMHIDIYQMLIKRMESVGKDGGSGRIEIWNNGLSLFLDNPVQGIGIYNFRDYNAELFGQGIYMHNTFLEILVESGVIGSVLFFIFWALLFFRIMSIVRMDKSKAFLLGAYVSISISLMFLSLIASEYLFLFLALIWRYSMTEKEYLYREQIKLEGK